MRRVVVVDDDYRSRRVIQILVERMGLESRAFGDAREALDFLTQEKAALVMTDLKMPQMDGIEFMQKLRELDDAVPVIMMTAYGSVESAVEAMKLGAVDYLTKPIDIDMIEVLIRRSLETSRHRKENLYFRELESQIPDFEDIVGHTPAMCAVFDLIRKVAPTRSTVMIRGETGTGKELVARAVHNLSSRKDGLFVPLNCTAIPRELLESELFGHVRGAFSGAHADRVGKFQTADGGTLFLDEIGDMEYGLQAKLLRVLEEGVIQPVGSNRIIPVDVRILSSTHRDLESAMREGQFREDLFYRLNVFEIQLPSLAERRDDIPTLAVAFLKAFATEFGKGSLSLSESAVSLLKACAWRGNVRELRNVMERVAVLAEGEEIGEDMIRLLMPDTPEQEERSDHPSTDLDLASAVSDVERRTILRALAASDDNKTKAAALLGIGERTLFTKLKRYGI